VGTKAFKRATKKGATFNIYAMPITEWVKGPVALLIRYKEFQGVSKKKNADMLPKHRSYDCAIAL
jgi:hypothetical protein